MYEEDSIVYKSLYISVLCFFFLLCMALDMEFCAMDIPNSPEITASTLSRHRHFKISCKFDAIDLDLTDSSRFGLYGPLE